MRFRATIWGILSIALVGATCPLYAQQPTIDQLVQQLSSDDAQKRYAAADGLVSHTDQADRAVPALTKALSSNDPQLQWRAARTLGAMGEAAKPALAQLQKSLSSSNPLVRGWSVHALGKIGAASRPAAAEIAKLLTDQDDDVQRAAVGALIEIRPEPKQFVRYMRQALDDSDMDPSIIVPALHALASSGDEGVAVLVEALKNDKARYWACIALGAAGPKAKAATQPLTRMLAQQDPEIRMQAAIALGEIGAGTKAESPQLVKALSDDHNSVRYAAAYAIGQIGAPGAKEELTKQLSADDSFLKMISAWALARTNPDDKAIVDRAVNLLVESLKDENPRVRAAAARGLHELKAPPEIVVPAFTALLEDDDPIVRGNIIDALATLDESIAPRLATGLDNPKTRPIAIGVIRRLGPKAKALAPALAKHLKSDDPEHRREIAFALAAIGPDAAAAVPALAEALGDAEPRVQYAACYALGKIGPAAKQAIPALQEASNKDDAFLKMASVWALLRVQPNDKPLQTLAIPLLIRAVQEDERELVRVEAAETLGDIGTAAAPAIEPLEKAAKDDPSSSVRAAATAALAKIKAQ